MGLSTHSQAVSTQGSGDFRQSLILTREKSINIFITGANGPSWKCWSVRPSKDQRIQEEQEHGEEFEKQEKTNRQIWHLQSLWVSASRVTESGGMESDDSITVVKTNLTSPVIWVRWQHYSSENRNKHISNIVPWNNCNTAWHLWHQSVTISMKWFVTCSFISSLFSLYAAVQVFNLISFVICILTKEET